MKCGAARGWIKTALIIPPVFMKS